MNDLKLKVNEKYYQYINRVCELKRQGFVPQSWQTVASIINDELGLAYSESYYRKKWFEEEDEKVLLSNSSKGFYIGELLLSDFHEAIKSEPNLDEDKSVSSDEAVEDALVQMEKLKMKISEERIQARADLRRISREETIKEIATMAVKELCKNYPLLPRIRNEFNVVASNKEGILNLSDWHYGIEVDNYWNKYNPLIAEMRLGNLTEKVIKIVKENNIRTLHIVDLGDLICGRIHLSLRLQSRIDVITQVMNVSELLAQFITELSEHVDRIYYHSCLDNHSRLEPIKSDSLELETLVRIIPWFLKERLKGLTELGAFSVEENKYDKDIITFETLGHKVACVHGHHDQPGKVVDNLTMITKEKFDLICTAHYHHFSADEKNEVVVVGNGSLMGTDTYAKTLRLTSKPSQNFIIVTEDNVISDIKRILV